MENRNKIFYEAILDISEFNKSGDRAIAKLKELEQLSKQVNKTLIDTVNYRRRSVIKNFLINLLFLFAGCIFGGIFVWLAIRFGLIV